MKLRLKTRALALGCTEAGTAVIRAPWSTLISIKINGNKTLEP
jgi:hypothetical protein